MQTFKLWSIKPLYLLYCQISNRLRLASILDMDYVPNILLIASPLRRRRNLSLRINGRELYVPQSDFDTFREVFIFQEYRTTLRDVDFVLDLGGNVGFSSIYFKKIWPRSTIHVFEPIPNHVETLYQNVGMHNDIVVHPYAVGCDDDQVLFEVKGPGSTSFVANGDENASSVMCGQVDVFETFRGLQLSGRGCLKIDIEGTEWQLFDDERFVNFINCFELAFIEVHEFAGRTVSEFENSVLPTLEANNWEWLKIRNLEGWASVFRLNKILLGTTDVS